MQLFLYSEGLRAQTQTLSVTAVRLSSVADQKLLEICSNIQISDC